MHDYDYLILIKIILVMYLPSFYKMKFEKYTFNGRVFLPFAAPGVLWGNFIII